jgi:ribonuclease HI/probable phosphoglycerate mutase
VLYEGEKRVGVLSEAIGVTTNNQAEYRAVMAGLEAAERLGAKEVDLRLDSELIVNQLKGSYRVKNAELKPLFARVKELLRRFESVTVEHVPREQNREADALVNGALDGPS